jgi:hypothetical protein
MIRYALVALALLSTSALADDSKTTIAVMDSMLHQAIEREAAATIRLVQLQQQMNDLQQACAAQTPKKSSAQLSEK